MILLGTALKIKEPPFHRCLIISDPEENGGHVVLVRLTTDDGTWPDSDCIVTPEEWSELSHPSTVAYSTCKIGLAVPALENAIKIGSFELIPSPSQEVLRKVIAGALRAAGMSPAAKKLLPPI
jgi:hypothetical protein